MSTDVDDRVEVDVPEEPRPPAGSAPAVRLLAHRITASSRERLVEALACRIVEDADAVGDEPVDLIVVSTRMPLGQASGVLAGFRRMETVPVVAIVHAGGEDLATELLRAGAAGHVAEGNESAVAAFLDRTDTDATLVEAYDQRLGRGRPTDPGSPSRDPVTGLPTRADLDGRVAEAAQLGESPRIGFLEVLNYEEAVRRLSSEATHLFRRRLAAEFREIGRLYDAEVFSLAEARFAFLAPGLPADTARGMGRMLTRAAEFFAPSGVRPLILAVGHAGPEVTTEVVAIRELAERALSLASTASESVVLSAEDLSATLAATTELTVLLRMVAAVERQRLFAPVAEAVVARNAAGVGRGERVARIAGALAEQLGFEGIERSQIRLAGHLHEIGKLSMPAMAIAAPEDLSGDRLELYRRYPAIGAEYLRVSAGEPVAAAVRHHQERWDGAGWPDALAEEDIPIGARILALAVALDEARHSEGDEVSAAELDAVSADEGRFDPTVLEAAARLFGRGTPTPVSDGPAEPEDPSPAGLAPDDRDAD